MADLVWYRSIYWRIALGFVALVATLLVLQILVFLWISGRMDDLFPNRTPAQFAGTIATDLSAGLVDQPTLDVDAFVNSRYSGASRGFAVVLSDGRAVVSRRVPPPPMLARIARSRLFDDPYSDRRAGGRFRGRGPDGDDRPEFGAGSIGWPRRTERAGRGVRVHQRERHGRRDCCRAGRAAAAVDDLAGLGTDTGHRCLWPAGGRHDGRGARDLSSGTSSFERAAGRRTRNWRGRGGRAGTGDRRRRGVTPGAQLQRDGQRARRADAGARTFGPHPTPAPRRRLPRAVHTARGNPGLRRDAQHG